MRKKYTFVWLLLCLVSLNLISCRTSREEQAARSVDDFFKAIEEENFEKVGDLSTEDSRPVLIQVSEEAKKHRKEVKPEKVTIVIVDKKVEDDHAIITVNIQVGTQIKKEKVRLVWVKDNWRVVVQKPQIKLVRYVVFYNQYDSVVLPRIRLTRSVTEVKTSEKHKHPRHQGRGHAYGHHKHRDHDN